jgi:hypothetical protein
LFRFHQNQKAFSHYTILPLFGLTLSSPADMMDVLRLALAITLIGFCFLCAEAQTTIHVSVSTGADGPSCGTTGSPCASLAGALTVLSSGPGSIVIAAGTYSGATNTNLSITLSDVSIIGTGAVTFSGGGTVQGWTLNGNGNSIQNIIFSRLYTPGLFCPVR